MQLVIFIFLTWVVGPWVLKEGCDPSLKCTFYTHFWTYAIFHKNKMKQGMTAILLCKPWDLLSQSCAVPSFNTSFFGHEIKGARLFQQFVRAAIFYNLPVV